MRHRISFTPEEAEAVRMALDRVLCEGAGIDPPDFPAHDQFNLIGKAWSKFEAVTRQEQEGMEDEREVAGGGQDVG